ncbi:MAG: DUF1565 domain-containing protein [Myxococcota bacterium]
MGDVSGRSSIDVAVTATTTYTLTAVNGGGQVTATATVTVLPDTTAPTVALDAQPTSLVAPGTVAAQVTADDDVGVSAVELWLDDALFATDAAGPDYAFDVPFALADVGPHELVAIAYDAAGHASATDPVAIDVSEPDLRRFVSPSGDDTNNTACARAAPCKTMLRAANLAAGQYDVILTNGTYDTQNQGGSTVTLPAGTRLVAESVGQAVVKVALVVSGGSVSGIVIDRTAPNAAGNAQIRVTGGVEAISAVAFKGSYGGSGTSEGLRVMGSASATLTPGGVADYTADTLALGNTAGQTPFIRVQDTATFVVDGGRFGGPGLGAASTIGANGAGAAMVVQNQASLTLRGATLSFKAVAAALMNDGQLHLEDSALSCNSAGTNMAMIHLQSGAAGGTPRLFMSGAHLDGAGFTGTYGIRVYDAATSAVIALDASIIEGGRVGVWNSGTLTLTATDSTIRQNPYGGIKCDGGCSIDWRGGAISGNAGGGTLATPYGGLWLGSATAVNHLTLRGATITGNKGVVGNPNIDRNDNSGIVLKGAAGSSFDLGTAADPGLNTIRDNTQGAATASLWLNSAGVIAYASGNTWDASVQGTDAAGHFVLGTAPCGASAPCDAVSGGGTVFRVNAGTLRLIE